MVGSANMWKPTSLAVALAAFHCGGVLGLGETFGADMMASIKPVPEAYDVASVLRANGTTIRDTECKNCPYGNCINFGWIPAGLTAPFQCFTQGESVGNTKTWLRYAFGSRQDEFCYVSTYDLESGKGDYTVELPYCGTKSELSFYLPTQKIKTIYYTECSLCPWRDCEGLKFYQSGATLDVNCQVTDGWNQLGPLHPDGTRKYYRTLDNCYVSVNTVEDLAQRTPAIPPTSTRPTNLMQEPLPYCGPVPHLKAVNRPGLLEDSRPVIEPATPQNPGPVAAAAAPPLAQISQGAPKPAPVKSVPPNPPPVPPRSTPQIVPEEEEENDDDEGPLGLKGRTVRIIRAPSASCRTCPKSSCKAAERLVQRQKTKVHCSTTPGGPKQFLRTASSCYLHGKDTDLSRDEARKLPKC